MGPSRTSASRRTRPTIPFRRPHRRIPPPGRQRPPRPPTTRSAAMAALKPAPRRSLDPRSDALPDEGARQPRHPAPCLRPQRHHRSAKHNLRRRRNSPRCRPPEPRPFRSRNPPPTSPKSRKSSSPISHRSPHTSPRRMVFPIVSSSQPLLGGFTPDPPASVYAPLLAFLKRDDAPGPIGLAVVTDLLQIGPVSDFNRRRNREIPAPLRSDLRLPRQSCRPHRQPALTNLRR